MPVLKTERTELRLTLPSSVEGDEAWAIVYTDIRADDVTNSENPEEKTTTIATIAKIIKDWNFTTTTGEKAPINEEYVKLLDAFDLAYIVQETRLQEKAKPFQDAKKKNLSSTSQESPTLKMA